MQPTNPNLRLLLVFLAAGFAALAAAPPVDIPGWVAALIAAVAAGFAGLQVVPPSWHLTAGKTRAFKRNAPPQTGQGIVDPVKRKHDLPGPEKHGKTRSTSFMIALALSLLVGAGGFVAPSFAASPKIDVGETRVVAKYTPTQVQKSQAWKHADPSFRAAYKKALLQRHSSDKKIAKAATAYLHLADALYTCADFTWPTAMAYYPGRDAYMGWLPTDPWERGSSTALGVTLMWRDHPFWRDGQQFSWWYVPTLGVGCAVYGNDPGYVQEVGVYHWQYSWGRIFKYYQGSNWAQW